MDNLFVVWAHKEGLHAPKNIIFAMHNHCYQVIKVKINIRQSSSWASHWRILAINMTVVRKWAQNFI